MSTQALACPSAKGSTARRTDAERLSRGNAPRSPPSAAWGAWLHFRSAYLQVRFIRLRNALPAAGPERAAALREIRKILREEIRLARRLHGLAARDSTIGFEATNQYAYSTQDLKEKVLNCELLLARMR